MTACESPLKEAASVKGGGRGWLVCMLFEGELFTIPGNLPVLGGPVPPEPARPQKSEHWKYVVNTGSSEQKKSPRTTQMVSGGVRI